jgi:hypothetical protein
VAGQEAERMSSVAGSTWAVASADGDATTGLLLSVVIEGVLSDAAKGAGASLIGTLALYATVWWIWHAVTAVRPRGSGAGSVYDDAPRANTTV